MPQPQSSPPSGMASPSWDYNRLIPVVPKPRTTSKTESSGASTLSLPLTESSSASSLSLPPTESPVVWSERFPQCPCISHNSSPLYSPSDYEALYYLAIDYQCPCRACSAASLALYKDHACMTSGLPCTTQCATRYSTGKCCTCPPCMLFSVREWLGARCELTGFYPTPTTNPKYSRKEVLRARLSKINSKVLDTADEVLFVLCGGYRGHLRTYVTVTNLLHRHVLRRKD